jgi:hypothetical protein
MGLCIAVYRWSLGDCTNGGASAAVKDICVINMSGPSEPNERAPAFMLTKGPSGDPILKPVQGKTGIGPMFGGNFAHSSDSRFGEAIEAMTGRRFWGALPIFDRFESPEENRLYGA